VGNQIHCQYPTSCNPKTHSIGSIKNAERCLVFEISFSNFLTTLNLLNGTYLFRDLLLVLLVGQRGERAADRQVPLRERCRLDGFRSHVVQGRCKLHALPKGLLGRLQNLDPDKRVIPPVRIKVQEAAGKGPAARPAEP
jgi:hypothetical protein